MILFLLGTALAGDLINRPDAPPAVDGECEKSYPIRMGQSLPNALVPRSPNAACSAVAVPLSHYADLLATEVWAETIAQQHSIAVAALEMERDWYKTRLEEETQPPRFIDRPSTQRVLGRIETLITVSIVAVSVGAAYHYSNGGTK